MFDAADVPADWRAALADALAAPSTARLTAFLSDRRAAGAAIYPPASQLFRALELTPLNSVRVVILGQDPYLKPGQAHGLSFSVQPGVPVPPSLVNIYKELQTDLGIPPARHGFLEHWARQGVLLLNDFLTVEHGVAKSHKGKGWEPLTDAIIKTATAQGRPCAFLLWGNEAKQKAAFVDEERHLVLTAHHPSQRSVRGFFGCRHFSRTNRWLEAQGLLPIDWALPPV